MELDLVRWLNGKAARWFPFAVLVDVICRFGHLVFVVYGVWLWMGGGTWARQRRRSAALTALVSVFICSCLSFLMGKVWRRGRPFTQDLGIWNFTAHKPNASFPSHHTMYATAVSLVLLRAGMPGAFFLALFSVVLAFSRMFAGIHYLSDLVGAVGMAALVHTAVWRSRFLQMAARVLAEVSLYLDFRRQQEASGFFRSRWKV